MGTGRLVTIQGVANLDERMAKRNKPYPRYQHKWALEAKAAEYPLCPQCNEPLPKKDWGKQKYCSFCRSLNGKY